MLSILNKLCFPSFADIIWILSKCIVHATGNKTNTILPNNGLLCFIFFR